MFFKRKEFAKDIEWILNIFAVIIFEKKDSIHILLKEILSKEFFTENDKMKYKEFLLENNLTLESINKEAIKRKYCKCEKTDKGEIKCEIDEKLKDIIPVNSKDVKELYKNLLAISEIVYTYRDIILKIQKGEVDELKKLLTEDSNVTEVLFS